MALRSSVRLPPHRLPTTPLAWLSGWLDDSTEVQQLLRDARLDPASRRKVKLGQLEAWRWTNVRMGDREVATLFVGIHLTGSVACDL